MRLTKKFKNIYVYNFDKNCDFEERKERSIETHNKIVDKFGQLEDIEDELGIDLITLHKSFEEDIWIKFDNKIMFVPYDKKVFVFYEGNINCYPTNESYGYTVSIKDYGKTWALTKEELE